MSFSKWQALGNDFVVLDRRATNCGDTPPAARWPSEAAVRRLADRRTGIGCDQLIVLLPPPQTAVRSSKEKAKHPPLSSSIFLQRPVDRRLFPPPPLRQDEAGAVPQCRMQIFNADGSAAGACGNATRCVGLLLMRDGGSATAVVHTAAGGALHVSKWSPPAAAAVQDALRPVPWVRVDMGRPRFGWRDVPLSSAAGGGGSGGGDLGLCHGPLRGGLAVSVGNPHVVFFLGRDEGALADVALATAAQQVQALPLFPEGVNVSLAQVSEDGSRIDLRVYERGAGETGACGTGACATFAAARRLKRCQAAADICFATGALHLSEAQDTGNLLMAGEAVEVFQGTLAPALAALLGQGGPPSSGK